MRKMFIAILCLSISMMTKAQNFNRSVSLNCQVAVDTVLYPFDGNPATSIGITGQVTFTSELGFVRFVVNDNYDDEYMIFESYRLFESDSTFSFSQKCEESCFFESYSPTELIVQVYDAIVNINSIETSNTTYSNPEFLRLTAKAAANNQKLTKIQNYIQNKGLIWIANSTKTSSMSYKQKAKIFGEGFRTYGYEFFSKGFFSIFGPDRYSSSKNFVCNFDWRNRHGANNPQSSYYDGDSFGTGWITPVVCQSGGCWLNDSFDCYINAEECERLGGDYRGASTCWIFGPTAQVEALTNLYYNQHLDVDLSEQFIACRENTIEANQPWKALIHYKQEGVPLESCLPYSASLENCEDLCADSLIRVRVSDYTDHSQHSMTDLLLKQYIINKGPLTAASLPLWYGLNHHCMALVGWGTIDEDVVENILGVPYENGNYDKDFLGLTYWIYKESMGIDEDNSDNGFKYILHINNYAPEHTYSISTPIFYDNLTEQDVRCVDMDGDGYYNWGIGPKPAHCPPCPDEPDGDDSNPNLGPLNSFGQCTIIGTYNASFENGWDNWMQVEVPNRDNGIFWRHSTPPPSNFTGPSHAQDGDYYIYVDTREMTNYNQTYSCIESPDINLHGSCNNILDFYYNMNIYDWNSGDDQPRIILSTQTDNNNWTFHHPSWSMKGDQGPDWQHASILLPSDVKKVRLYVETGKYHFSDIAIDNITIGPWNYNNTPIIINENTLWDENKIFNQDIIIENGGCLTIRKTSGTNLKIKLHSDIKIIVKPGGKLILDHCTLTNACPNELWQGIEVWGNSSTHQYEVNGSYGQGYLEMRNGAVIENAKCAVELWRPGYYSATGGIIYATDATFRNNAKAVHALWYTNHSYLNGEETPYNSYFHNCSFLIDEDYMGLDTFYKHVDMSHIYGISFLGCDFSVNRHILGISPWCVGIGAYESGFLVNAYCDNPITLPCPDEYIIPSSFYGFYRGIHASNDGSAACSFSVRNSMFDNNTCGVYALNTGYSIVVNNDFTVGCGSDCDFGIYADEVSSFCFEENTFHPRANNVGSPYGIVIVNSDGTNDVYRNSFANLRCGNVAIGNNVGNSIAAPGLTYNCNTNSSNVIDFCVLKDGNVGDIASSQGSSTMPAGNTFGGSQYHFYNDGNQVISYYYDNSEPDQMPVSSLLYRVSANGIQGSNSCVSHYGNDIPVVKSSSEKAALESDYFSALLTYSTLRQLLESRIDGGSTPTQVADISNATPDDMWRLRAQLLGLSPYVSGEVLTTAADRYDVFTDPVLFEILAANPDELKKDSLISYLENKANPLPTYMTDLLRQIASGFTARTALMAQMTQYNHAYSLAAGDIVRSNLNDSVANPTELRTWLGNMGDIASDRMIVASYLQEGDSLNAFTLASLLPELYGLQGDALSDHSDYMRLIVLHQTLNREHRTVYELTEAEALMVDSIATWGTGTSKAMAEAMLMERSGEYIPISPCPSMPNAGGGNRGMGNVTNTSVNEALGFTANISPNPATTWTTVDYTLPANMSKATLAITNTLGVTVMSTELNGKQGQKVLDLRGLADGVYVYRVRCGEYIYSGKLIITK